MRASSVPTLPCTSKISRLLPLGKTRAYLLLGVLWGLWHAPLVAVGLNYPGYPLLGIIWMCGLTMALGIYINELALRERSTLLAGWLHGLINSQSYGIWRILFPAVNPLLGGITGLVGIGVWLAIGLNEIWQHSIPAKRATTPARTNTLIVRWYRSRNLWKSR